MKQFKVELNSGVVAIIEAGENQTAESWLQHQPRYIRVDGSTFQQVDEIVNIVELPAKKLSA